MASIILQKRKMPLKAKLQTAKQYPINYLKSVNLLLNRLPVGWCFCERQGF